VLLSGTSPVKITNSNKGLSCNFLSGLLLSFRGLPFVVLGSFSQIILPAECYLRFRKSLFSLIYHQLAIADKAVASSLQNSKVGSIKAKTTPRI
jgi:hypothetical protein